MGGRGNDRGDLLLPALDNLHTLGIEMAGSFGAGIGLKVRVAASGLPTALLLPLLAELQPRAVGLSIALPAQVAQVLEVAEALDAWPGPRPLLLAGGHAVRRGSCGALPGTVRLMGDLRELADLHVGPG